MIRTLCMTISWCHAEPVFYVFWHSMNVCPSPLLGTNCSSPPRPQAGRAPLLPPHSLRPHPPPPGSTHTLVPLSVIISNPRNRTNLIFNDPKLVRLYLQIRVKFGHGCPYGFFGCFWSLIVKHFTIAVGLTVCRTNCWGNKRSRT